MWGDGLRDEILEHFDDAQNADAGDRSALVAAGLPANYWEAGFATFDKHRLRAAQIERNKELSRELAVLRRANAPRMKVAPVDPEHECPLCERRFGNVRACTGHLGTAHADVGVVTCVHTRVTFSSKTALFRAQRKAQSRATSTARRQQSPREAVERAPLLVRRSSTEMSWQEKERLALTIECPICEAPPGYECLVPHPSRQGSHAHRRRRAFQLDTGADPLLNGDMALPAILVPRQR